MMQTPSSQARLLVAFSLSAWKAFLVIISNMICIMHALNVIFQKNRPYACLNSNLTKKFTDLISLFGHVGSEVVADGPRVQR